MSVPRRQPLHDAAVELNRAAIHLLRGLRSVDRAAGLTPARLSALSVLVYGGPLPVGRLAATEDVASPTMTRIVDGLEALGLARRAQSELNGRVRLVEATPAGIALMRAAADRRARAIVEALRRLPAPDRAVVVAAASPLASLPARLPRTVG